MDGFDIRRIMTAKKITATSIAHSLGVTAQAVSQVIHGRRPSRRISQAIADAMGMPLEEVFPKYRRDKESQSPRTGAREAA